MNDETNIPTNISDASGIRNGLVEKVTDTMGSALTGIPSPIRKNAIKAFSQLCTAAVDIPVAYLEGIAAEMRTETRARIKIINTGADQIASQMKVDPEYAKIAVKKYGQKIVKEQINLDVIAETARRELTLDSTKLKDCPKKSDECEDISEDWLNTFEKEACNKSSDEMRLMFGKILAGEIRKPSSYSIKTIKLISQLDNQAAKLFQTYCSLAVSLQHDNFIFDGRVISLNGNAASNSLKKYGLSFSALNILQEYGLIISDYNSYMDYKVCIANKNNHVEFPFKYQGKSFGLVPQSENANNNLSLHGVGLSKSGKEILNVIDILPKNDYTNDLIKYFENKNLKMVEIKQSI